MKAPLTATLKQNDEVILCVRTEDVIDEDTNIYVLDPYAFYRSHLDKALNDAGEPVGDARFRQIIPYCVLLDTDNNVFVFKRTKTGGEGRLSEKTSVGVGGHVDVLEYIYLNDSIDEITLDKSCSLTNSMRGIISASSKRELDEEVKLVNGGDLNECLTPLSFDVPRLIIDNSNDVGKLHVGLFVAMQFDRNQYGELTNKEDQLQSLGFMPIEDALQLPNNEPWTKIVLERLRLALK